MQPQPRPDGHELMTSLARLLCGCPIHWDLPSVSARMTQSLGADCSPPGDFSLPLAGVTAH
eukprot:6167199-Prymnesium_polylepis.2